jgi:hypothetical protein
VTTFPDLSNFQADTTDDGLTLPINGTEYTFHSKLPFGRALQIQALRAEAERIVKARLAGEPAAVPSAEFLERMADYDETEIYLGLIGDEMRERLVADQVDYEKVLHVGATLLAWHLNGEAVARRVWTSGKEADENRPPAEASGTSTARTTSRSGSTKRKPRKRKPRNTPGRTTSTAGH